MNLDTDNALLLTLMISQSRCSRELITHKSKGSIVSRNCMCTKVIAAARTSLKRANKAADLIRTETKLFDFYTWCIWIFNHNALDFYHDSLRWNVTMTSCRFKYHHAQHVLYGSSSAKTWIMPSNGRMIFKCRIDIQTQLNWMWILILFEPLKVSVPM